MPSPSAARSSATSRSSSTAVISIPRSTRRVLGGVGVDGRVLARLGDNLCHPVRARHRPDADRPHPHCRRGGRGAAPGGRQGHAGRGALRLRAALQSRGAAPRGGRRRLCPEGLRAPQRLASPRGRAGRDPRLPRLRRPVPARIRAQDRRSGLPAGPCRLHRRLPCRQSDPEPGSRPPAAA